MTKSGQAKQLAEFLAPMLQDASRDGIDHTSRGRLGPDELIDRTQPDVDLAVRLELNRILSKAPSFLRPSTNGGKPTQADVCDSLRQRLERGDTHTLAVLWALLAGGDDRPHADVLKLTAPVSAEGRLRKFARGLRSVLAFLPNFLRRSGWVRRKVAGIWMNALVAFVLGIAWWLAWPPPGAPPAGIVALGVFAVWSLSFLPGWMYVRFLDQRAGALWDEYVLNLHRLGWDNPRHLPKPQVNSQFYAEWFESGGDLLTYRPNIYRQKFDTYYGKSVSETRHGTEFRVQTETLFPVFLLTATLAACWTAVLWNPSFASSPSSVWDILKFGFLGAYSFILQMLIRRFFQSDLRPSAYAHAMLRIIVVLILVAALHQLLPQGNPRTEAVIAFILGFFPLVGMQALQRMAAAVLRAVVPSLNQPYPLNQIDGLSIWYEARLLEEGIEDMQSLATANFVDVMLHTRVPAGRLVDWVDQAHLYLQLDRIEHGWFERTLAARHVKLSSKNTDNTSKKAGESPKDDIRPFAQKNDRVASDSIVRGSVTETSRAGTWTRTMLRQLGIRKATDLLQAVPPEHIDPETPLAQDDPAAEHLKALEDAGLDLAQLRSIVRVLSRDSSLAPVWNWQSRGVRLRTETAATS
jgi:hypothetical protein